MKDSVVVQALGLQLASDFKGLEAGAGSFVSFGAITMQDRQITAKILRRIGRNQMAALNDVVHTRDADLSVTVSSRAPWGGLSFLVVRARKESEPRFRPWQQRAIMGLATVAVGAFVVWSMFGGRIWPHHFRADIDSLRARVEQLEGASAKDE